MNEEVNLEKKEISKNDNQDVSAALKKMQDQLNSMEEKIDSLIRQSKPRTFKENRFSKPRNEYDKTRGPRERKYEGKYEGKKEEVTSEGKFYHGRPFGKKKDGGKVDFSRGKRSFKKSSKKK